MDSFLLIAAELVTALCMVILTVTYVQRGKK